MLSTLYATPQIHTAASNLLCLNPPRAPDCFRCTKRQTLRHLSRSHNEAVLSRGEQTDSSSQHTCLLDNEIRLDWAASQRLESCYAWGSKLGTGGNAAVYAVQDLWTSSNYACKSIPKELKGPRWSEEKKRTHLASIQNEIAALQALQDDPHVVRLINVFEDENFIHIVMEACQGGELVHTSGVQAYSEQQVCQIMATVLGIISRCHASGFLHRDIKPGNFMLARDQDLSSLRGIDFGLAVPFRQKELPLEDLGLEGTAWFMAPEVLSSKVSPAADVWSAGIMTAQLLTGRFPFDDFRNPTRPAITKIWQAILCKEVDFKKACWDGISDLGRDFVRTVLIKDQAKRPSADKALQHPWFKETMIRC